VGRGHHVVSAVVEWSLTPIENFSPLRSVGGAETIPTTMAWWTLAMLVYPETQARAQAELDAVVGRERLPTFADYPCLPYIRAMVKEVLRWKPVGPLGGPHRCTEDDWYEGMFIPKGSICLPNVWYMNRDPKIYGENASHFEPARYLDANGDIIPALPDAKEEGHATYGFGRRICIGRYVANDSLFINMAILLWATKIERKKDRLGQLLPLDVDGYEDHGLMVLADSSYASQLMLTLGTSADVRSLSSVRFLRASQRLPPCLHRNVSYGGCEYEVTSMYT
jgi:cytochrome P450